MNFPIPNSIENSILTNSTFHMKFDNKDDNDDHWREVIKQYKYLFKKSINEDVNSQTHPDRRLGVYPS